METNSMEQHYNTCQKLLVTRFKQTDGLNRLNRSEYYSCYAYIILKENHLLGINKNSEHDRLGIQSIGYFVFFSY